MPIKKRSKLPEQAALLADEIADRPYGGGQESEQLIPDEYVITSISIPHSMLCDLEDIALKNKRAKSGPKNVSALIRLAVSNLFTKEQQ